MTYCSSPNQMFQVKLLLLVITVSSAFAGRYLSRNRECNLNLPSTAITFTKVVSNRVECLAEFAPIPDACCTIYNNVTHNCTVVRSDRFQLVVNASAELEVGIDKSFTFCDANPEAVSPNASSTSPLLFSRAKGSVAHLQCSNSNPTIEVVCNASGQWQPVNNSCTPGSMAFTSDGTFTVPAGVSSLRAVTVGGGGGGGGGYYGGGGGGYVTCGAFTVWSGTQIPVVVGTSGNGGQTTSSWGVSPGQTNGGASSFGNLIVAAGGSGCGALYRCDGGTGSGGTDTGGSGSNGGQGGSDGGNGASASDGTSGGTGQGTGSYSACRSLAKFHILTAGAGGSGGQCTSFCPGGGGGGVLLDGQGPTAGTGTAGNPYNAYGGTGYGAGGGGGGNTGSYATFYGGGNGASGLVYVEWD